MHHPQVSLFQQRELVAPKKLGTSFYRDSVYISTIHISSLFS